jgi:hypothetical protein
MITSKGAGPSHRRFIFWESLCGKLKIGRSDRKRAWGVIGFPSVYILDGEGKIRFTCLTEKDELERALDELLSEKASLAKKP